MWYDCTSCIILLSFAQSKCLKYCYTVFFHTLLCRTNCDIGTLRHRNSGISTFAVFHQDVLKTASHATLETQSIISNHFHCLLQKVFPTTLAGSYCNSSCKWLVQSSFDISIESGDCRSVCQSAAIQSSIDMLIHSHLTVAQLLTSDSQEE